MSWYIMNKMYIFACVAIVMIVGCFFYYGQRDTKKLVGEAIHTGNMVPVFELYRNAAVEDKQRVAYEIAEASYKITIEEVDGRNNREFLRVLFNAVNNQRNTNLHIEAGGRDEYLSPFVALVKYAYVQSELAYLKEDTENKIKDCLVVGTDINVDLLDPHKANDITGILKENVDGVYFKDLLWKNYSLQKVYKPLNQVKLDLQDMYANLKLIKAHYRNLTPNIDFGGLKFNSTEAEFYSKAPLKLEKGTGTIHLTKVFGNGVAVEFVPFFPNLVQESVTFTSSFTGVASNGIKMGDSINDVMRKMKPYYQLKNNNDWVTYLMPNGQTYTFRFDNGYLDQINIREAPGWKG